MATQSVERIPPDTLPVRLYLARNDGRRVTSMREAAQRIGVSHTTWQEWERGRSEPRYSQLRQIADALNVDYEWLVHGGRLGGGGGGTQPPQPKVTPLKVHSQTTRRHTRLAEKSASVRSNTPLAA
jgi:transcriptional regulator with XRE-family HTH domain